MGLVFLQKASGDERGEGQSLVVVAKNSLRPLACIILTYFFSTKIVWPDEWNDALGANDPVPVYLLTVDGTHCRFHEPTHPTWSKNPGFYSHKHKQAALNYEVALHMYEPRVVWISGPHRAGEADVTVFREAGLKQLIPQGRKGVADGGYRGEKQTLRQRNSYDTEEVRRFKGRARSRQETFNARIKIFSVLSGLFRHGVEKHQICFEAVCVIVQYQMENGSPIFDV